MESVSDTAGRLRRAAEELLLEKGPTATTLRDITDRAGANVASVSYHYGSKDALLALAFREVLEEATQIQRRRLEALAPDAPLEDVVRAWLAPALPAAVRDPHEARLWSIIHKGLAEKAPGLIEQTAAIRDVVEEHLIERLAVRLPHLDRDELLVRHAVTMAAVAAMGDGGLAPFLRGQDPDALSCLLVAWVVGGLRAPGASSSGR